MQRAARSPPVATDIGRRFSFCSGSSGFDGAALEALGHTWAVEQ